MPDRDSLTAEERAKRYLNRKLGGRRGFDLWSLVEENEELEREIIEECANEFRAHARAAAEKMQENAAWVAEEYGDYESAQRIRSLPLDEPEPPAPKRGTDK